MRYYRIDIGGQTAYTSHPNGPTSLPDPGALNVEIDIPVGPEHLPMGGAMVRVWGIGLQVIAQSSSLTGKSISVYGGMGVGLPLATVQEPQAGLLVQGSIYPAFGNWILTDQTLDLIISSKPAEGEYKPANLVHQAKQGQQLGDAVKQTLQRAYPSYTVNVQLSNKLVMPHDDTGFYQSAEQFSDYIRKISTSIFGGGSFESQTNYLGARIAFSGQTITVSDGTDNSSSAKTINFYDLLGQPTWLGFNKIQVKTIMRGDINLLDKVTLPPSLATTSAASNPQLRDNSVFQGTFQVQQIRHVGNFRQPDGMSWNTTFDMVSLNSPGN